jgi:hypothetical protein
MRFQVFSLWHAVEDRDSGGCDAESAKSLDDLRTLFRDDVETGVRDSPQGIGPHLEDVWPNFSQVVE